MDEEKVKKLRNTYELYTLSYSSGSSSFSFDTLISPNNYFSVSRLIDIIVFKHHSLGHYVCMDAKENINIGYKRNFIDSWKLTDTLIILGDYLTYKATTNVDGDEITAFYCPKIAISEGPSFFSGLPGLIVSLETPSDRWELKETKFPDSLIIRELPKNFVEVSKIEFEKYVKQKISAY